jgi:muramoyltetrapeptide carboxypeptidase
MPLETGDTIEIIAPGSYAPTEHLLKGVEILKSWGFKVIFDQDILKPHIFLAQSDEYRFTQFKKAMNNPESKVIWCLRGGYGSIRLLPELEKMKRPAKPKVLVGLSDVSSLQTVITQKWNFPTLHGPLIDRLALERITEQNIVEVKSALMNPNFVMSFKGLTGLNPPAKLKKTIKSSVVGGNLMVIASTLGTPSQIKTDGKIIFLEEITERAYRVDRCLQQMKQAGCFKKAKAIVFGDFTNCNEPNGDNYIQEILQEFSQHLKIPVYTGIENGHGDLQRPLFFNAPATLTTGDRAELQVSSPFGKV